MDPPGSSRNLDDQLDVFSFPFHSPILYERYIPRRAGMALIQHTRPDSPGGILDYNLDKTACSRIRVIIDDALLWALISVSSRFREFS